MRFSLKDLFWLTLVSAVVFGWYRSSENYRHGITYLENTVDDLCYQRWVLRDRHDWFWRDGIYINADETVEPQASSDDFRTAMGRD